MPKRLAQSEMLRRIFEDSQVIDVDWFDWDRCIRLCVLADHLPFVNRRLPAFCIEFVDVLSFRFSNVRSNKRNAVGDHNLRRGWWTNGYLERPRRDGRWEITIGEMPVDPIHLRIVARDVRITKVQHKNLDKAFPGWGKRHHGLLRPGLPGYLTEIPAVEA